MKKRQPRYEVFYINKPEGIDSMVHGAYGLAASVVSVTPNRIEPDGPHRYRVTDWMVLVQVRAVRG